MITLRNILIKVSTTMMDRRLNRGIEATSENGLFLRKKRGWSEVEGASFLAQKLVGGG